MKRNLVIVAAMTVGLGACATADGTQTAVQRAMGQCVVSVGGGALLGAVIGNNIGDGDAKRGAVIGAVAGAGVCGFLLYRASEEDKARIRQLEIAALNADAVGRSEESFVASNGKDNVVVETITEEVEPENLPVQLVPASVAPAPATEAPAMSDAEAGEVPAAEDVKYTNCRYVTQNLTVEDDTINGSRQLTCRTETGDWVNF